MSAVNPNTPCGSGREAHAWEESGLGWRCRVCGAGIELAEACGEPTGSCDNCGANVYEGEDLCGECGWYADRANEDDEEDEP